MQLKSQQSLGAPSAVCTSRLHLCLAAFSTTASSSHAQLPTNLSHLLRSQVKPRGKLFFSVVGRRASTFTRSHTALAKPIINLASSPCHMEFSCTLSDTILLDLRYFYTEPRFKRVYLCQYVLYYAPMSFVAIKLCTSILLILTNILFMYQHDSVNQS